jgi:hypothetical protein
VSTAAPTDFPVAVEEHQIGQGDDVAVALAVSGDPTIDVLAYLRDSAFPVGKLVVIKPVAGTGMTSIAGEAEALGYVYSAFDTIRSVSRGAPRLHLFAQCPNGVGVLLGHLWNRMPDTQLYDDSHDGTGYFPTFTL